MRRAAGCTPYGLLAAATCAVALLAGAPAAQARDCATPAAGYARAVLATEALRAYFRLGETAGPVACDSAGEAEGTFSGDVGLGRPGALATDADSAADFARAGTVRVPSSDALSPGDELTLEAWVKPASNTASETVVRKDRQYLLRLVGGSVVFRVWTSAGLFETASAPVLRTAYFQHIVAVFNGSGIRIYRNGSQIASEEAFGRVPATTSGLYLGSSSGAYDFYAGSLDEVAVYGRALPTGTVKDHYAAGAAPSGESFVGCGFGGFGVGSWPGGCWRPYSAVSPFNQRLGAAPRVSPDSAAVVARILSFGAAGKLVAGEAGSPDDYGHPTYFSGPGDPLFALHCYETAWGSCPIEGHQIRIPDAAQPAAGGDAHLTVVDQDHGWEYDLYKVRSKPPGGGVLELRWGGRTRIDGDGLGGEATAAGFGTLAGIIRTAELDARRIDHALFMTVRCDAGRHVFPADGHGRSCQQLGLPTDDAPPMGTRLQLQMTAAEIDALPVPDWKKTILRAMAGYGMFIGDTGGGSWGIALESGATYTSFGHPDPLLAFAQTNAWTPYQDRYVADLHDDIDWTRLRVIDPCTTQRTC